MIRLVCLFCFIAFSISLHANDSGISKLKNKKCACNTIPSRFSTNKTNTGMVLIPKGSFMMGADNKQAQADEYPKHAVEVNAFWLDMTPVTNRQFQKFVEAAGYVTTAEKKPEWEEIKKQLPPDTPKPDDSKLVAASLVFTPPDHPVNLQDYSQWWSWTPGANWQHPRGPNSNIEKLANHPVVHMSWYDAKAYCNWLGKRLATEAEWEWAARGGLVNTIYTWGDEPIDSGTVKANTWQGAFPYKNTLRDRFYYTSPVKSFPANGYGLYDMSGNVWEWVADWYRADYYQSLTNKITHDPQGPEKSYDPEEPYALKRVLRGGSFLCNEQYCTGYRVASRMKTTPDTSMQHMGFRCAQSN